MESLYKVQTRFLFHANIKIKIPSEYDEEVLDVLFGILEEVDRKYNSYSKDSFFDRINKNNGSFTDVDVETVEILEKAVYYSGLLNGEYDITIMPLIRLWGFYRKNVSSVPSDEEIDEIRKLVDYRKIIVDREKRQVKIGAGQEIITGSFIKSYAVDKVVEKMRELGIRSAVINAGGSSIATLSENDNDLWEIVVENPENESEIEKNEKGYPFRITEDKYKNISEDNDLFDIGISNESFSTSNQVNTSLEINGKKYGHIISPKTGYPGRNRQIGIITEKAFIGDMISTGLYNQTPSEFYRIMKVLQKELRIEGYMIDENGFFHYSDGFLDYIVNHY